jgi:hypothetical protein
MVNSMEMKDSSIDMAGDTFTLAFVGDKHVRPLLTGLSRAKLGLLRSELVEAKARESAYAKMCRATNRPDAWDESVAEAFREQESGFRHYTYARLYDLVLDNPYGYRGHRLVLLEEFSIGL